MAKRKVGRRGRWNIAAIIAVFLVVAVAVVLRRSRGAGMAKELQSMATQRSQLASRRAQLESEIRSLSSMSRLGPQVQGRLGMRVPDDSQVILLPRPVRREDR